MAMSRRLELRRTCQSCGYRPALLEMPLKNPASPCPLFGQCGQKLPLAVPKVSPSVAVPLQPRGFLELRPNYSCMLLFCGAALQLLRAGATGSAMRILEEQAWNGAKTTMF